MRRSISLFLLTAMFVLPVLGQKSSKPWPEWSKKDSEKMLNQSAWAQTQDETDQRDSNFTTTGSTPTRAGSGDAASQSGPLAVRYYVRFFSAKPIREALARMILLQQKNADEQKLKHLATRLQGWIDGDIGDNIVVAVIIDAPDFRLAAPLGQALRGVTSETLKNRCYLERKGGTRNFLTQYEQATPDQTGTKFIFQRTVEGKPFLVPENESVRFVCEISDKMKIDRKFDVENMMYNGKLEY